MKNKSVSKWVVRILAAPETNLFLFAFLLNFVYEVWQAPYYEFYGMPSLSDKINDLTHCTFGDGVITLISGWVVSALARSRYWILNPGWQLALSFTCIGWFITLVTETYRVNIAKTYGVPVLALPVLGISWLAVFQWIILPPLVLYLARRHLLGWGMDGRG
ncbi:hypothetical protein CEN49_02325 [Fischerella thermalis CCMEE 5273]|uniref:Uncharacterized protein n=1 Tax=Chlorogloeopsis fritschii PCC 6912 TaxID=211165 RepID=A0A433NL97_CHLFR|nr:hypothetical protein [Chlorogloeopsis fritschii]PMB11174.1 hypothetical protein CEN49_02325 [Fischerella thermalis CCMEE 5273]PMB47379.1 hypothetical protein CEN40_08870 [Fischerella thermalis CCMEE 5205]RUR83704.1 hypothetical protein PCC6912_19470 [Chlorogloeopsis fritschii PCC 6912]